MFSSEEKALLVKALLARRSEIMGDLQSATQVVETLLQVGAGPEAIAPHQAYVELYRHEFQQVFELSNKVFREL